MDKSEDLIGQPTVDHDATAQLYDLAASVEVTNGTELASAIRQRARFVDAYVERLCSVAYGAGYADGLTDAGNGLTYGEWARRKRGGNVE